MRAGGISYEMGLTVCPGGCAILFYGVQFTCFELSFGSFACDGHCRLAVENLFSERATYCRAGRVGIGYAEP